MAGLGQALWLVVDAVEAAVLGRLSGAVACGLPTQGMRSYIFACTSKYIARHDMVEARKPPAALGIHLDVANKLWRAAMDDAVKSINLTRPHWLALSAIADLGDGCTLKDVVMHLNAEISTMSRALVFLDKHKLIERLALSQDKRAKSLCMTALGRERLEQLDDISSGARSELLDGVSEADLESFYRVIFSIKRNATRMLYGDVLPLEFAAMASQYDEADADDDSC
jgi:MarR family transcriptional regulator for hemolysin